MAPMAKYTEARGRKALTMLEHAVKNFSEMARRNEIDGTTTDDDIEAKNYLLDMVLVAKEQLGLR